MAAPRKENVQKLILDTTENLLKTKSYREISLSEIARQAHVAKGTLYYYYPTREDLFMALLDRYLTSSWQELVDWSSQPEKDSSLPRLLKFVLLRDTTSIGMRLSFIASAGAGNEQLRRMVIDRYQKYEKMLAELIAQRTENVNPDYAAWTILLLSDGLLIHQNLGDPNIEVNDYVQELEKFVRSISKKSLKHSS